MFLFPPPSRFNRWRTFVPTTEMAVWKFSCTDRSLQDIAHAGESKIPPHLAPSLHEGVHRQQRGPC